MKYFSTILICILPLLGFAQSVKTTKTDSTLCVKDYNAKLKKDVYSSVDEMPEFPEGDLGVMSFIHKHRSLKGVKDPQSLIKFEIVIDVDGTVIDQKIPNKEPRDYTALEKEYIRVIKLMPKWKPGKCKGKTVPFLYRAKISLNWSS